MHTHDYSVSWKSGGKLRRVFVDTKREADEVVALLRKTKGVSEVMSGKATHYVGNPKGSRVLSHNVHALTYQHAHSAKGRNYRHDFDKGVQALLNSDGSVTLRHPRKRLWETRTVGDNE